MKEATGEANMTIITVVLIGIILAAGTFLVNSLMQRTQGNADCQAQGLCYDGNGCVACPTTNNGN